MVEKGLFILDDYTVPVQSVESSNQDQVFLKLTKADFKNAPLAEEVEPANYAPVDTVDETVEEDTEDTRAVPIDDTTRPADRV